MKRKNMKHIKLFESYLFEASNAESLESPEISKAGSVVDYLVANKGEEKSSRNKGSEYFAECKKFAASLVGKVMRVPNYGMITKASFKMEGFADCSFAIMRAKGSGGSGVWNKGTRKEESKMETGYYPSVFVAGSVTKDKSFADGDFNAEIYGAKKEITPALSGYYCYLLVCKRRGEELDLQGTTGKFTMQELVALDPQWKAYFQGLINIASGTS